MTDKKTVLLKCWLRSFVAYSAISFLWVAFIANGMSNSNKAISEFANQMVTSNLMIMLYSLAYGFSVLLLKNKKMSGPAKYSLHILVNYVSAMVAVYALFSNTATKAEGANTWMAVILLATVVFFVIYGLVAAVTHFVKKKFA